MSAKGSKVSIYGAIIANIAIAISKFFAGAYTGSSAMISEGIHSVVDTSNGILLLYGIKRSERPADVSHPFGYGMEIYFWSFVVAILIFALGGGIAIYEGIHHIIQPSKVENVKVNYIVLILAILFEGTSLLVALREFKKDNDKYGLIKSMRRSKDSSSFAVIIEDLGAIIGLVVALMGLVIGDIFDFAYADGIASVIIGVILTVMAFFLATETKALMIGESIDDESLQHVQNILKNQDSIDAYGIIRSVHFGPTGVMIGVDVDFGLQYSLNDIEREIVDIEQKIKEKLPFIEHVFIEVKESIKLGEELK
jgi:cation diffusion facilitator family transporter